MALGLLLSKEISCHHESFERDSCFVTCFFLHCKAKIRFDGFLNAAGGDQGEGEKDGTGVVAFVPEFLSCESILLGLATPISNCF